MILHREINTLKQQLMSLAALVEDRLSMAVKSVEERDLDVAIQVIEGDEEIDGLEVELEEECLKVLALHQPVAIDLRVLVAALKINSDLERIGDLAMDIAERGRYFATHQNLEIPYDFSLMAQKVQRMVQDCLDAFVNLDSGLAQKVCAADDDVDDMHADTYRLVRESIQAKPDETEYYLWALSLSRFLERIADHSTNISEDIIYMIEGDVVRHTRDIY